MIADSFSTFDPAQLGEDFAAAFKALKEMTAETPVGRHDISENVYVNVMEYDASEPWEPAELEAHRVYADIQVVLGGNDRYVAMCHGCFVKRIKEEQNNANQ
jgi:YhcH/YjgK/YiaL family protein